MPTFSFYLHNSRLTRMCIVLLSLSLSITPTIEVQGNSTFLTTRLNRQDSVSHIVGSGQKHTCVVNTNGGVECWGENNYGQLGDGTTVNRRNPVTVSGLSSGVEAISQGDYHTCALTTDGAVKCWGLNDVGQLGDGTNTNATTPVDVSSLSSGVTALTSGNDHTCALTSSGGVKCWGKNNYGQLGIGTTTDSNIPVDVLDLTSTIVTFAAGSEHMCVLNSAGKARCWGYNGYSQTQAGAAIYYTSAVNPKTFYAWESTTPEQSWSIYGDQAFAALGSSVSTAGDVNGDGYDDIMISSPYYDGTYNDEGAVFIFYGSADSLNQTANLTITGSAASMRFGWSAATAGDVNGDGYDDVIIGATGCGNAETQEGCAYLYLGTADGLNTTPTWSLESNQSYATLGYTVGSIGDVNGDGYADVFVTAPGYKQTLDGEGIVYVFYGSVAGLTVSANWSIPGKEENAVWGYSASSAGDVNGDGYSDLVISAPNASAEYSGEGKAELFLGSVMGLGTDSSWSTTGGQAEAHFGEMVSSAEDINGDGFDDLMVSASDFDVTLSNSELSDAGKVFAYYGSNSGLSETASWTDSNQQAGSNFGSTLSLAGDIDQDGYADILISANRFSNTENSEGIVYLYHGSATGLPTASDWSAEGGQNYAGFGYSINRAGDIDGDGYDEFLISAPQMDQNQVDGGQVSLFFLP